MIGRKAIVSFSLLSVLLFCAVGANDASAVSHTAKNTTAFTCVFLGGARDFADEHCDETVTPGKGKFGHELIPSGATFTEVSNEGTVNKTFEAAVSTLKGKVPGSETHIDCKTVSGTGTIENGGFGTDHQIAGQLTTAFSNCTVTKPLNCKVKEPIKVEANYMGVDELNFENNMGLEFEPKGTSFTEIAFEGASCALKGKFFPVTGSAIATGAPGGNARETGATSIFENTKGMQNLKLGAEPVEFSSITTTRAAAGNPIALTTTT